MLREFVIDLFTDTAAISSSETQGQSVGEEKRRDESFHVPAKEPLGTDSRRTISKKIKRMPAPDWAQKSALYYCAQSANSFS